MRYKQPGPVEPERRAAIRWEPTPQQHTFVRVHGEIEEALFGGARMGGKTDALLIWKFLRRQKYPGSRGGFIRRQLTELTKQGAAWPRAKQLLGDSVVYNEGDMTITFPNGSVEEFGHCKTPADAEHYKGAQYDDLAFDQLEELTESMYLLIQASCRVAQTDEAPRDRNGVRIEARIRATANPGGIGHSWVKKAFIDAAPPGTVFTRQFEVENPVTGLTETIERRRVFVPSTIFDNPHADEQYKATLAQLPEPYRSMYLLGTWDVRIGQAFPDFHPIHPSKFTPFHVIDVDTIPDHWDRMEFHDWGHIHPTVTLWFAADPDGGGIIYRELAGKGWRPNEIARQILTARGPDPIYTTWCGLDIWSTNVARVSDPTEKVEHLQEMQSANASIERQYDAEGLRTCQPTTSVERIPGKQMVHSWLADRGDGIPWLRIMRNCNTLIETLQLIPMDPNRYEDVQKNIDPQLGITDDAYDALRYGLVSIGHPGQALTAFTPFANMPTTAVEMSTR